MQRGSKSVLNLIEGQTGRLCQTSHATKKKKKDTQKSYIHIASLHCSLVVGDDTDSGFEKHFGTAHERLRHDGKIKAHSTRAH